MKTNGDWCPVCGLAWQVRGCAPGKCATPVVAARHRLSLRDLPGDTDEDTVVNVDSGVRRPRTEGTRG